MSPIPAVINGIMGPEDSDLGQEGASTQGSYPKLNLVQAAQLVFKKSLPVAISRIIFSANTLFFGATLRRLGEDAIASGPVFTTLQYLATGTSYGILLASGILMGEKYGAGELNASEYREVGNVSRASWQIAGVLYLSTASFLISVPRVLALAKVIRVGVENNVNNYFLYYGLAALPPVLAGVTDQQLAAATKDGFLPILFNLIYTGIASGLGIPMALGYFGDSLKGTKGYGVSTAISAWCSLVATRTYYYFNSRYARYDLFKLRFDKNKFYLKELRHLGIRTGSQAFVEFLHLMGTSLLLARFGNYHGQPSLVLAAPALQLASAIGMVSIGYGQVQGALISNERGAIKEAFQRNDIASTLHAKRNISLIGYMGTALGLSVSLVPAAICWGAPEFVVGQFVDRASVGEDAFVESAKILEVSAVGLLFDMLRNTLSGNLKGFRDVNFATIASFLIMNIAFFAAGESALLFSDSPIENFMWLRNIAILLTALVDGYRWVCFDRKSPRDQLGEELPLLSANSSSLFSSSQEGNLDEEVATDEPLDESTPLLENGGTNELSNLSTKKTS